MAAEVTRKKTRVATRTLLIADVVAVTKILQESPEVANWSGESLEEALKLSGTLALVNVAAGEVSGFLIGRQVDDEAEVLNLAVAPSGRRQGQGAAILQAAMDEFQARGVSRVFLEVRESNAAAIAFYSKHGFAKTGYRPSYYRDPVEAAVLLEKKLTG